MPSQDNDAASAYWFSKNASKAWAEKFFLAYLPFSLLSMRLNKRLAG